MESRTLNSKRNIIVGVLGNFVPPVFALVVNSAIVRNLSVAYVGLFGTISSVLQILNLAELGFSASIIVNLYKPLKNNDTSAVRGILAFYRRVYRIIGLTILVIGVIVCPFLKRLIEDAGGIREDIYLVYLLFLINKVIAFFLFAHKEALLNAAQRLDLIKIVYIFTYAARNCLQLFAVIVLKNVYLYAIALILETVIYYVCLDILSKKKFGQYYPEGTIDEATKQTVREQVMGLTVSNILGVSRDALNSILTTSFFGLYIAGQFINYNRIYDLVIGFFLVITKAIMASIGNSIVSETAEKNYRTLTKMEFLHNIAVTACTAYMLSLYQPFMKFWMGEDLMFPDPVMALFVLYFHIRAMSEVRNAYFSALGYWWKAKWIFVAEAVAVILLMVGLGKTMGVPGIVLAPSITVLTVNYVGITNLLFKEYFGTGRREYYTNRILYTLITVAVSAAAWYLCGLVTLEGIAGLIVRLAVCTLVLVVTVPAAMFVVKREYMKESFTFIKQILRARE